MRVPNALSPSAMLLWSDNKEEYCIRYLCDNRPEREPQTPAASVGSSFDAWVKSNLHAALFGENADPAYTFNAMFEDSVEPQNRDQARAEGLDCFDNYIQSGAYDDLLKDMQEAKEEPSFERTENCMIDGVPISGKPDARYVDKFGNHIILDWKVRGYHSNYNQSPTKGFMLCRDGHGWVERNLTKKQLDLKKAGAEVVGKNSNTHNKSHKDFKPFDLNGRTINEAYFETCKREYAVQLCMYGWMLGEGVGSENMVACIDELCCKPVEGEKPLIRVANHCARISKDFQLELLATLKQLWEGINSGHVFNDLSREENDEKLQILSLKAIGAVSDGSDLENWFNEFSRPGFKCSK